MKVEKEHTREANRQRRKKQKGEGDGKATDIGKGQRGNTSDAAKES